MRMYFLGGPLDGQCFMGIPDFEAPDSYAMEFYHQEVEFAPGLFAQQGDIVMRHTPVNPVSQDLRHGGEVVQHRETER